VADSNVEDQATRVRMLANYLEKQGAFDDLAPWLREVADAFACPVMVTEFYYDLPIGSGRTTCNGSFVTLDEKSALEHLQSCRRHPLALIKIRGPK